MARKNNYIKAFSHDLNDIIMIKKLTERQFTIAYNKLVKFIMNAESGKFNFPAYVHLVIECTLPTKDKVVFQSRIDLLDKDPDLDPRQMLKARFFGAYYTAITDYYPEFKVEHICIDISPGIEKDDQGIIDSIIRDSLREDEEFKKKLDSRIKQKKPKKKSDKSNKYSLETLDEIDNLKKSLRKDVIGQDEAIEKVCNAIKLRAAGFIGHVNLFFIGKTGRGKTQLAKSLGANYSPNLWTINCAEFTNGHEVSRLLGSPPGYIGHTEKSLIKEKADTSNKWVIVFDEIEKAHPKFFNVLLSLLDTGTVTDNIGNEIDLTESIFIMTSNCGVSDLKTKYVGFNAAPPGKEGYRDSVLESLEQSFSPEFRGRIDEFVFFNDLNSGDIEKIAKLMLSKYPIKPTGEVVSYIISKGFSEEYGARNIKRAVRDLVGLPLAEVILKKEVPDNGTNTYEAHILDDKFEVVNTVVAF